jgi:hypothetical protein
VKTPLGGRIGYNDGKLNGEANANTKLGENTTLGGRIGYNDGKLKLGERRSANANSPSSVKTPPSAVASATTTASSTRTPT